MRRINDDISVGDSVIMHGNGIIHGIIKEIHVGVSGIKYFDIFIYHNSSIHSRILHNVYRSEFTKI